MTAPVSSALAHDPTREWVQRLLSDKYETSISVVQLHRQRSDYASWYASDVITATLATGEVVRLFLKDLGSYRAPKDDMRQRRERELRVYRDLLSSADLGTATYFGSVWNEELGQFWLLLELVPGQPLAYCEFSYWIEAAAWLGRMHGAFARDLDRLRACAVLMRRDNRFFQATARPALLAASQVAPELLPRLLPSTRIYENALPLIAAQPPTLLHGAFRPQEILVDSSRVPSRICPVDWELAGIGPPLFDLAFFVDGFSSERLDVLVTAYASEAARAGMTLPSRERTRSLIHCYRLFRALNRISHAAERAYAPADVSRLIDQAAQISQQLVEVL